MKRHIGLLLLLFVIQNVCSMEQQIIRLSPEQDEKCKLAAKYLHKYPDGESKEEKKKIKLFFAGKTSADDDLVTCVNSYKRILLLQDVFNLLPEVGIKKEIFTRALWDYASRCYVTENTCYFIAINNNLVSKYNAINCNCGHYMPYFLSEIHGNNDFNIFFSETNIRPIEANKPIQVSDFSDNGKIFAKEIWCHMYKNSDPLCCRSRQLTFRKEEKYNFKKLVVFLDDKEKRMKDFEQFLNQRLGYLLCKNGDNEGVDYFIGLLRYYRNSPKWFAQQYAWTLKTTASEIVEHLSSVYEKETKRKHA